ncbi:hypothetical protein BDZ91DRAFT_745925 [Kalaharituber pfeilii]|nr:hypothetical protein BDZ91DRAFT_745925 [Kalaharituber pfeilii]
MGSSTFAPEEPSVSPSASTSILSHPPTPPPLLSLCRFRSARACRFRRLPFDAFGVIYRRRCSPIGARRAQRRSRMELWSSLDSITGLWIESYG